MRNKVEYCNETKKFCYSSEAKACRAMAKYDDIKRVFRCDHCEKWHTTSWTKEMAIRAGIVEEVNIRPPTLDDIKNRLEELEEKLTKG